jgi:hypothetical protein
MKQKPGSLKTTDKPLTNLTKMRGKNTQINKIRNERWRSQQTSMKSRDSLGTTLKVYIQINWKI